MKNYRKTKPSEEVILAYIEPRKQSCSSTSSSSSQTENVNGALSLHLQVEGEHLKGKRDLQKCPAMLFCQSFPSPVTGFSNAKLVVSEYHTVSQESLPACTHRAICTSAHSLQAVQKKPPLQLVRIFSLRCIVGSNVLSIAEFP